MSKIEALEMVTRCVTNLTIVTTPANVANVGRALDLLSALKELETKEDQALQAETDAEDDGKEQAPENQ